MNGNADRAPASPPSDRLARVRQRIRRLKTLPVLPTTLTAGNLASGITAILCAAHDQLFVGALMIFVAMVCDMFDGKVARLTKQDGPFGAELDSLADVVSFGVAPAILVHRLILGHSGVFDHGERLLWFVTVLYPVLTAIRLARYNVEHTGPNPEANSHFRGIPSPGAAAVVCALVLLHSKEFVMLGVPQRTNYVSLLDSLDWFRWFLLVVTLVSALTMVSTVRYPHIGNMLLGRMSFRRFILLGGLVALLVWEPWWVLAAGTFGYLLWGLGVGAWQALSQLRAGKDPLEDEDEAEAEDAGLANGNDSGPGPAHGR